MDALFGTKKPLRWWTLFMAQRNYSVDANFMAQKKLLRWWMPFTAQKTGNITAFFFFYRQKIDSLTQMAKFNINSDR